MVCDLYQTVEGGDHLLLFGQVRSASTAESRKVDGGHRVTGRWYYILLSAHGAASFADASPLQRIWRDSSVAARHAVVLPMVGYEVYGKALLGREDHITPLI